LLALRKEDPVLSRSGREGLFAEANGDVLVVRRENAHGVRTLYANFGRSAVSFEQLGLAAHVVPLHDSAAFLRPISQGITLANALLSPAQALLIATDPMKVP
jgi:hypothetical protein